MVAIVGLGFSRITGRRRVGGGLDRGSREMGWITITGIMVISQSTDESLCTLQYSTALKWTHKRE